MAGEAWRLFLALWPPESVREQLVGLQQAWQWAPSTALVKPERLHVTLHFMGSVEASRIDALEGGLRVPFEPFVLDTQDAQAKVWRGGIAVLELRTPPALQRLHGALADALRAQALPVEARAFRPHVTFARKAFGARAPAAIPPLEWPVREGYVLARTVPGRGYTIVHRHR